MLFRLIQYIKKSFNAKKYGEIIFLIFIIIVFLPIMIVLDILVLIIISPVLCYNKFKCENIIFQ